MPDTGAPWNIPYADPTDLVRDWPDLSEDVAEAVAAGLTAAGSLRQYVSATDATQRTTTSTSFTDASISVSITPTNTSSTLLIGWVFTFYSQAPGGSGAYGARVQITNSSNTALQGAEGAGVIWDGVQAAAQPSGTGPMFLLAQVAATDLSARTYKGRFRSEAGGSTIIRNTASTGRMFVMEVK